MISQDRNLLFDRAWERPVQPFCFSKRRNFNFFEPASPLEIEGVTKKVCRGQNCGCLLPLSEFMRNRNMADGYDLYCIRCNQRKRAERMNNKPSFESAFYFSGDASHFGIPAITDSFVSPSAKPLSFDPVSGFRKEAILNTIEQKMTDARLRYKQKLHVCKDEIYDRLFNGNFHCLRYNCRLTPECFMNHHVLTVLIDGVDVDLVVSECICASALETQGYINIEEEFSHVAMEREKETIEIVDSSVF